MIQSSDGGGILKKWPVRDARARFCAMVNAAVEHGLQLLTRRGVEVAVLVSTETLDRMRATARPEFRGVPASSEPRDEKLVPKRGTRRRRPRLES
ncbi:MAG: type II toxin-antitoxin system prevent-host-death family antitoxin [Terriglobales bacterium]